MNKNTLFFIEKISKLNHHERIQKIIDIEDTNSPDSRPSFLRFFLGSSNTLESLISDLSQSNDPNIRYLALISHIQTQQTEKIISALTDPSVLVRCLASRSITAEFIHDDIIVNMVLNATKAIQKIIINGVVRNNRQGAANRLLPKLLERDLMSEARLLLASCHQDVINKHLERFKFEHMPWVRLAYKHPQICIHTTKLFLERNANRNRKNSWFFIKKAIPRLIQTHPQAVMALFEEHIPIQDLPAWLLKPLSLLLAPLEDRVIQFICSPNRAKDRQSVRLPSSITHRISHLSSENQKNIFTAFINNNEACIKLFKTLPPSKRQTIFAHATSSIDTENIIWSTQLMSVLPHSTRHKEAARIRQLKSIIESPYRFQEYLSFGSLEEAEEPLTKLCRAPDAVQRSYAWLYRINLVNYNRKGTPELFKLFTRLFNEQDPVRSFALSALKNLPLVLFEAHHATELNALADAVINARDTSQQSRQYLQQHANRLLCYFATNPKHPLFQHALDTLKKCAGQKGLLGFHRMDQGLPKGAEEPLIESLLPFLEHQQKRLYSQQVIHVCRLLGKRFWGSVSLNQLLQQIIMHQNEHASLDSAVRLWLADPKTRDKRVRWVLDQDMSAFKLSIVANHLHRHRQEWLDPYLSGAPLKGHWGTGDVGYIHLFEGGFQRWSTSQQKRYALVLKGLINDHGQNVWTRTSGVSSLAKLPISTISDMTDYFNHSIITISESAMASSVWLDAPQDALEPLMGQLDGDRARIAMYAIPRVARYISPLILGQKLLLLLNKDRIKVTVHKEAIRLIGQYNVPNAIDILIEQWRQPKLHRDVRIAVLHAISHHLDDPRSWQVIEELSNSENPDLAKSLFRLSPSHIPKLQRQHYLTCLTRLSSHSDVNVRADLFFYLWSVVTIWTEFDGQIAEAASQSIEDVNYGHGWVNALKTLAYTARTPHGLTRTCDTLNQLLKRLSQELNTPVSKDDLPIRTRIERLLSIMHINSYSDPTVYMPVCKKLVDILHQYPNWQTELGVHVFKIQLRQLNWAVTSFDFATLLTHIEPEPHPLQWDRYAYVFCSEIEKGVHQDTIFFEICEKLMEGSFFHRWLALSIINAGANRAKWPIKWRTLLNKLRSDPQPILASRAKQIRLHI